MVYRNLKPLVWCVWIALFLPVNRVLAGGGNPVKNHSAAKAAKAAAFAEEVTALYEQFNLQEVGLTKKAFSYAFTGASLVEQSQYFIDLRYESVEPEQAALCTGHGDEAGRGQYVRSAWPGFRRGVCAVFLQQSVFA